ncbi:MAG: hypothetical protein ACFFAJ_05590 [Candidatus Hodarchaeota archaeon]
MVSVPATTADCLRCKGGKFLCGLPYCPIVLKTKALIPVRRLLPRLKNEYYGPSPPSLFVGRYGYPKVRLGPMASFDTEKIQIIDEPDQWQTNMSLEDIIGFRARLFRFMGEPHRVNDLSSLSKIVEITQEQVQSSLPVDLEIKFSKKPQIDLKFDRFTQPMGARFKIDSVQIASTPKIDHNIDRVVTDTDLNAINGVTRLYNGRASVTQIARIFSAGLLGETKNRRFVPTRWSITAVDDISGNNLRKRILDYPEIQDYLVFHNSYLDNDFWILFIPRRTWAFDYHETWKRLSAWNLSGDIPRILTDYEGPQGRKTYATNTVGGYYAARLAVQEKLVNMRRKAAVVAFREVGKGYAIPLGVWQVRENMRRALNKAHRRFTDLNEALSFIAERLSIPMRFYFKKSPILSHKTLDEFLNVSSTMI